MRYLKWAWAAVRWLIKSAGYWLRPYDMLADARRWRWQPAQRCGWSYGIRLPDEDTPRRTR